MPKFECEVVEEVRCVVILDVEAGTREEAAQIARNLWVENGEGDKHEAVLERWVEIDGEIVESGDT